MGRVFTYVIPPNLFHTPVSTYKRHQHTRAHIVGVRTFLYVKVRRLWVSFWCSVSRSSVAGPSVNRMTMTQCVCVCVCVCVWHGDAVIDETVAILANAKRTYPWREKMPQHTHTHTHAQGLQLPYLITPVVRAVWCPPVTYKINTPKDAEIYYH